MATFLIGIDDTDNDISPGTGQLARRLAAEIEQRGATLLGITRHQFLLDDRIACSSHNSGACLALEWGKPQSDLEFAIDLIGQWSAEGSDPGICIAGSNEVPREAMDWGWAATREVLTRDQATALAKRLDMCLRPLGGSGDGIIGALASVGLRADGNEGRFLELPGLRMLAEFVTLRELSHIGIHVDHKMPDGIAKSDLPPSAESRYKTLDWVRPRLVGGKAVWPVEWSQDEYAWIPVDRKKSRPLE
jgi:tRNA(Ile2) C34 agmatinyltransferase TiaS